MELNKAIYNKLIELAKDVFNKYVYCEFGVYSLNDLVKGKTKTGKKIDLSSDVNEIKYNINIESFSCTFAASAVFALAAKFEKLAKIGAKNKTLFSKSDNNGELVATFEVEKKTIESVAACDPLSAYAAFNGVFIDLLNKNFVCTNGHIININRLQAVNILVSSAIDKFSYKSYKCGGIIVPLNFIKKATGKLSLYKDNNNFYIVAESGISAVCESVLYPNYFDVFNLIDTNSCMILKNVRTFKKAAAKLAKANQVDTVSIFGVAGENCITIAAKNRALKSEDTIKIELQNTLNITFCKDIAIENIKAVNNIANTIYLNRNEYVVFTGTNYILLASITDVDQGERSETGAFARNNAIKLNCNYNILLESGFIADADNSEAAGNNYDDNNIVAIAVADADNSEAAGNNNDDNNVVAIAVADADNSEATGFITDMYKYIVIAACFLCFLIPKILLFPTIFAAGVNSVVVADNSEAAGNNNDDNNIVAIAVADADNSEAAGNNYDDNNVVAIAVADADNSEAAGNYYDYNIDNKNIASIIAPAKNHQNF